MSPTAQLASQVGLPRYTGMDAWAQGLADRHAPLDKGAYAAVLGGDQVSSDFGPYVKSYAATFGYTKVGIGYSNGYWVVVLNT